MRTFPDIDGQRGLFTAAQARRHGLWDWDLAAEVRSGRLQHVTRGVYARCRPLPGTRVDEHARLILAEQLAAGDGWHAARRSAAFLMGLPLIGRPPVVPQLVRDNGAGQAKATDRHRRISALPTRDRVTVEGVAMTTLARTVVDIARQESFRNAVVVADAAMRGGCSRQEMALVLRAQRRWPGVAAARRVVAFADGRAESPGESVARVAFVAEGLPAPEPQVNIWRGPEFIARVDFMLRDHLLVVESDGGVKFTGEGVLPDLLARHELIRDCGLDVVRTSWGETFKNTARFGYRVRDRMASGPGRRLAPNVWLESTVCPSQRAA